MVLPTLIKAFNATAWRTKRASIMMLGSMAHAAPKQLANCLPQIMPKLTEALKDAQSRVKDAGKAALDDIASVITNPEVELLVPLLKLALTKPSDHLEEALIALEEVRFCFCFCCCCCCLFVCRSHSHHFFVLFCHVIHVCSHSFFSFFSFFFSFATTHPLHTHRLIL